MIIENNIAGGVGFFHVDALSSAVAMKMASSLCRLPGTKIGNGYQNAKSRHLFRDFVDSTAVVAIREQDIQVKFQKRAHNPYLTSAGFGQTETAIPWLGWKKLNLVFG